MKLFLSVVLVIMILSGFVTTKKHYKNSDHYVTLNGIPTTQKFLSMMIFYTDTFPKPAIPFYNTYKVNYCDLAKIIHEIEYFDESERIDTSLICYLTYTIYGNGRINRYCTYRSEPSLRLLNKILNQISNPFVRKEFSEKLSNIQYYFDQ